MVKYMTACPKEAVIKRKADWINFSVYLSKKLDGNLSYFRTYGSFERLRNNMHNCAIVFADPVDAYKLWKSGFKVVAGIPRKIVSYIARKSGNGENMDTVFSIKDTYAYLLGLLSLTEMLGSISQLNFSFEDMWESCVKNALDTKNSVVIIYGENLDYMSNIIKSQLEVLSSKEGNHSHYLMVNPELYNTEDVLQILLDMSKDAEGKEIMQAINVDEWIPKNDLEDLEEELKMIKEKLKESQFIFD